MASLTLRRPTPKVQVTVPGQEHEGFVTIVHPVLNLGFLNLPCYSSSESSASGFDYAAILDACYILAGNCKGHLTIDQAGKVRVPVDDTEVYLKSGRYFYHLEDHLANYNYPICLDFNSWAFEPPPPRWTAARSKDSVNSHLVGSTLSAAVNYVKGRDRVCLISGIEWALEGAHLVPKDNGHWFRFYNAETYIKDETCGLGINSPANLITVMSVFNGTGLEQAYFTFIPMGNKFVVCSLRSSPEFAAQFHTQQVVFPERICTAFVYARFAWNIIKRAKDSIPHEFQDEFETVDVSPNLQAQIKPRSRQQRGGGEGGQDQQRGDDKTIEADEMTGDDGGSDDCSSASLVDNFVGRVPTSMWTVDALEGSKRLDGKVKEVYAGQDPAKVEDGAVYPGFSYFHALGVKYVSEHPAATDPGGARVATLGEILAGAEFGSED